MKKLLVLSILWLLATFYIAYDHYKLQQEAIDNIGFQQYLVYTRFLWGCNVGSKMAGRTDIDKYYWECVPLAFKEKKEFMKRMKYE